MHIRLRLVVAFALGAIAFGSAARSGPVPTPNTIASFDPSLGQLPESVTVDDQGNFYLSMSNTVQRLSPDGTLSLFAQLPIPAGSFALGVKFGPDGALYVASGSFNPADDASWVFKVDGTGAVTPLAHLDANGFPNDIAFDDAGNLYVTDPFLALLWKITPAGQATIWLADPLLAGNPDQPALLLHAFGADGIAMDRARRNLYVGNIDAGSIVRVPIGDDGSAGAPEVFAQDALIVGCDGIAFDEQENLYVAVNGQDQIAVVDRKGAVSLVARGGPLDSPSSLVFGPRENNRRNLYISNFAVLRAFGVKAGAPHPGLLVLPVPVPGLPLS